MQQEELDALARQNADSFKRQADNGTRVAQAVEQQAALLSTREQDWWLKLYEVHAKLRLGPSVVTTTTADSVMDDMVRDAVRMTQLVFPAVRAELEKI